jgi:hypothetical protein
MKTRAPFVLFLLVLCIDNWGCSAGVATYNVAGNWCLDHTCDYAALTFIADAGHEGALESAIDNLNQRADLGLFIGAYGVPVHFVPTVVDQNGESKCGITQIGWVHGQVISLDIYIATEHLDGCVPQWAVVRHEIACHALHPSAEHTESGVCSAYSTGGIDIDGMSMTAITLQD